MFNFSRYARPAIVAGLLTLAGLAATAQAHPPAAAPAPPPPALSALRGAVPPPGTPFLGLECPMYQLPSPNVGPGENVLYSMAFNGDNNGVFVGSSNDGTRDQAAIISWNGTILQFEPRPDLGPGRNDLYSVTPDLAGGLFAAGTAFSSTLGFQSSLLLRLDRLAQEAPLVQPTLGFQSSLLLRRPLFSDSSGWNVVPSPNGTGNTQYDAINCASPTNCWAVGTTNVGGIYQTFTTRSTGNGTSWTIIPSPNMGNGNNVLQGVAVLALDSAFSLGYSTNNGVTSELIEYWNGTALSIVPSPVVTGTNALTGISFVSPTEGYASGYQIDSSGHFHPLALYYNGTSWSLLPASSIDTIFNAVWAAGTNNVYFAGSSIVNGLVVPAVWHWNGVSGTVLQTASIGTGFNVFYAIGGFSTAWGAGYYNNSSGVGQTLVEHQDCGTPTPAATGTPATGTPVPTTTPGCAAGSGAGPACGMATATPLPPPSPTPCPAGVFSDVHPADYFYTPVTYLASHGVISGYGDCTFRPYSNTTRSQQVKIVVLGFAKPIVTPAGGAHTFADVPTTFPFFAVIETAAAATIVSGYNCGAPNEPCDTLNRPYFRPYANVTRGQLSKIDIVAAGWAVLNPATGPFTDVLAGTAFYRFVATAACHGVISGYACGGPGEPCDSTNRPYFRQYNQATRGQIAKIVYLSITAGAVCSLPTATPTATPGPSGFHTP
ncbi:MAG TPA: S-layer homology domain-containing protein [Chloroflexia bacterium]|nr:S-layer homology domain-containing protein [Chloroflexia bacterium]